MIIEKYGVKLCRLTENDLELVRTHRNSRNIQQKMFYQKKISKEEQRAWFSSINNIHNYYFIVNFKGVKIGLIHGKIRSFEDFEAEGGIFIWDENYIDSFVPVLASICMADVTFFLLRMKKTYAKVRLDNPIAISYNKKMGYKEVEIDTAKGSVTMVLSKDDYIDKTSKLRDAIQRLNNDYEQVSWKNIILTEEELKSDLYTMLPNYLKEQLFD